MKLNMSFLIKDDLLLEKYNEIQQKFKNGIRKEFDNKPIYNKKYLKDKIKSYDEKSRQIFTIIKYQEKFLNLFVYQ